MNEGPTEGQQRKTNYREESRKLLWWIRDKGYSNGQGNYAIVQSKVRHKEGAGGVCLDLGSNIAQEVRRTQASG